MKGSRLYQELLATAREFFDHSLAKEDGGDVVFRYSNGISQFNTSFFLCK